MSNLSSYINQDLTIPPPSVNILRPNKDDGDEDDDDGSSSDDQDTDVELWSFRLPTNLPLNSLNGLTINLNELSTSASASNLTSDGIRIENEGEEYRLMLGESMESETFRVLLPKSVGLNGSAPAATAAKPSMASSSTDDDDDGENCDENSDRDVNDDASIDGGGILKQKYKPQVDHDETKSDEDDVMDDGDDSHPSPSRNSHTYLYPCAVPFTRHFNVIKSFPKLSETQLAPLQTPESVDTMRHAYAPIPQRKGLKRRWMPMGISSDAKEIRNERKLQVHDETVTTISRKNTNGQRAVKSIEEPMAVPGDNSGEISPPATKNKVDADTIKQEESARIPIKEEEPPRKSAKKQKKEKKSKKMKKRSNLRSADNTT